MAATIARARGVHSTGATGTVHRLGHQAAEAEANTFQTFANITTSRDGSGTFNLRRGSQMLSVSWSSERGPLVCVALGSVQSFSRSALGEVIR